MKLGRRRVIEDGRITSGTGYQDPSSGLASVSSTALANLTTIGIGLFTGILAARLLGPVGEGQLTAIQTWPFLLGGLAMLGLPEALVYCVARDPARSRTLTSTATLLALCSAASVAGLAWIIMPRLLSAQPHRIVTDARVFLSVGAIYALVGIPHSALQGARQFTVWNVFRVLPGVVWAATLLIAWQTSYARPGPLSRWYLIGAVIGGIPIAVTSLRRLRGTARPSMALAPGLLRFGLPSVLTTIPETINLRLDQLLIIGILPARDLGLYVVAVSWSSAVSPLVAAIDSAVFPRIAAEGALLQRQRIIVEALQGSLLIGGAVAVLLVIAAPLGIPLVFGQRFEGSIVPAFLLVPAGAVLAWSGVAKASLRGLGRPVAALLVQVVGAVVTLVLLPALLHELGIIGAAVASLVGYLVVAGASTVALSRIAHLPLSQLAVPRATAFVMVRDRVIRVIRSRSSEVG